MTGMRGPSKGRSRARACQKEKQMSRRNFVVFFTDQQRWDMMQAHGNPVRVTPNLDREAVAGTHVTNSFTCQPICGPARACLQTGLYATNHGVFTNGITLVPGLPTLGLLFRDAGYRTAYFGKWHLGSQDPVPVSEQGGYEDWLAANALEATSRPYDTIVFDKEGAEVKLPGYRVDAITDVAIRYITTHADEPFFVFVSLLEPHHQNDLDDFVPPRGYREQYTGTWMPPDLAALGGSAHQHFGGYLGTVRRIDEAYGRLLDALESLGLRDETVVLFSSDHGCHFKTRNSEYKRSCHESSIRVPTVITGPGFFGGGALRELVSIVDLPPTLLDSASIPIPDSMEGRSLLPLLRREPRGWPDDVLIQISESQVGRAVRTHRWKYAVIAPDMDAERDRDSDHYIESELYDLRCDPYELTNLIGLESHREVANAMRARLLRRMASAGEAPPTIVSAQGRVSGQRRVLPGEVDE